MSEDQTATIELTGDIVTSYVAHNRVAARDVPALIAAVHEALAGLGMAAAPAEPESPKGVVSARKSLANPEHIISLIDGKPYRMLRRHLSNHGHTPESYRQAFGLPFDYPMTAPNYSEQRRALAHKIGLGRKPAPAPAPTEKRRTGTIKAFPSE
ncbi:MucR family transcriptional regulator [Sphingomonas sp. BIUV-7]|uniref:MucR family transcriptional regulator n=1 Tax=Sphingomonas natans TaxID=3063330 RepID=A0ABT8Y5I0_9SPHN|nr:MucR family transcriptional regulator [Sphingomonas sp. BIUV-7]MDO6413556.1 MucR family transcriptional regulator [Sphingomonas sp. BIUV-7]